MDTMIMRSKRPRLEDEEESPQQQPPPGRLDVDVDDPEEEEEEDGGAGGLDLDLISRLPDDLLGDVITRLPTKDGGRTQVLSRRWRPLWRAAPLNLEAETVTAADAILTSHRGGPGRRFSFTSRCHFDGFHAVDDMLRRPGLDGLQEFDLRYCPPYVLTMDGRRENPPPLSVLRFSPTLRVLSIRCRHSRLEFPPETAAAAAAYRSLDFPRLEQLTLNAVVISESTLHGILSRCHALQSLVLQHNAGYRLLRIRSPTLRSLGIWADSRCHGVLEEVIIENAPLLERFFTDGVRYGQQIKVIQAPKLKILGYLADTNYNESDTTIRLFKRMELLSLPSAMRTVTVLALDVAPDNLDVVIDFLGWFPCVEKLHMELSHWKLMMTELVVKSKNKRHNVSLECLDKNLKMLELTNYHGESSEVSLIRFFLSNARVLESFKLHAKHHKCDLKWVATQRRKLRLSNRASRGARVSFEPMMPDHRQSSICAPLKHIHNLALDDPFDLSSCTCLHDDRF